MANNEVNPPLITEMEILINFVNNRVKTLCEIYVNERRSNGDGLLFLTIADSQPNGSREVKLFYQKDEELQPNILNDLQNRRSNNTNDIVYFLLFTEDGQQNVLELDVRTHLGNE